jgi:RND superfamily putative drug exporter
LAALDHAFESYSRFIVRHPKIVVCAWIVAIVASIPFAVSLPSIISYSASVPSSNGQSQTAENLVATQFRAYTSSNSTFYVIIEGGNVLDPAFVTKYLQLNSSLFGNLSAEGLSGIQSAYTIEYSILYSLAANLSTLAPRVANLLINTNAGAYRLLSNITSENAHIQRLASNITGLSAALWNFSTLIGNIALQLHSLEQNISASNLALFATRQKALEATTLVDSLVTTVNVTNRELYELRAQVNDTSQLMYGVATSFGSAWLNEYRLNPTSTTPSINSAANTSFYPHLGRFGPEAKTFYTLFYQAWENATDSETAHSVYSHLATTADTAVASSAPGFASAAGLNSTEAKLAVAVSTYFNTTTYSNLTELNRFTLDYTSQGQNATYAEFARSVFMLGPKPNTTSVEGLAVHFATLNMSSQQAAFVSDAFYKIPLIGIENFTVLSVEANLNATQPEFGSQLKEQLNISEYDFLSEAYSLGATPRSAELAALASSLLSPLLSPKLGPELSQLGTNTSQLLPRISLLPFPISTSDMTRLLVQVFSNSSYFSQYPATSGFNISALISGAYALGRYPSNISSLKLAVNLTAESMTPQEAEQVVTQFGLNPRTFLSLVASIGTGRNTTESMEIAATLFSDSISTLNSTIANQISDSFLTRPSSFALEALRLGNPLNHTGLSRLVKGLLVNSTLSYSKNSPILVYNLTSLSQLAGESVNSTLNPSAVARSYLTAGAPSVFPLSPSSVVLSPFLDSSKNTTLVILHFSSPPSDNVTAQFEKIVTSAQSPGFKTFYTADTIVNSGIQSVVTAGEKISLPSGLISAIVIAGLFFFSPIAALLPTLLFGVTAGVGFGLVDLIMGRLGHQTLSFISPLVVLLLVLGLITDYAVLMLNRFRQELKLGKEEAVIKTTRRAGEAVFTSGLTVILSYVALSAAGIPLFSDVGSANLIMVSVLVFAALTLLPAMMTLLGDRAFWPARSRQIRPSRLAKITRAAVARPKRVLAALVVITLVTTAVAFTLPTNIDFYSLTPNNAGKEGLNQITQNFGGSTLVPTYVVVQLPSPLSVGNNAYNESELSWLANLTAQISRASGVTQVYGPLRMLNLSIPYTSLPEDSSAIRSQYASLIQHYVSTSNLSVYFQVVFSGNPFGNQVLDEAHSLSTELAETSGYKLYVGGGSLDSYGIISYVYQILPELVLVLTAAIFVVLFFQLRSVFTPLRLIATILSSVGWSLFLVWLIFYKFSGVSVFVFAPLFLVTTMLGVGMDYDIFMMVRVREEAARGRSDPEAIITTAETTAGVVFACGLILSAVFLSLGLTSIVLLQQIGLTLALGILLDSIIVWLIYVPSIMVVAKRLNWWPSDPRRKRETGATH